MLILNEEKRNVLWELLSKEIENYISTVDDARIVPASTVEDIEEILEKLDIENPEEPERILKLVTDALWTHQTHVSGSRYFGLFNPASSTMGIAADALVAAFNPQVGSWKHSPFAVQLEHFLIRTFGERFGLKKETLGGIFCTGGAEANHTAILTALVNKFPGYTENGLSENNLRPVIYVSTQTHHSIIKAVRLCGLGSRAVRFIEVDKDLKMIPENLENKIERDLADGFHPFMIAATAGTTNAGVIDSLDEITSIAGNYDIWFHVDAAWGGAAAFVPEFRKEFFGIERADSITFDAHKWMSVPMSAGIYLTSHKDILKKTFSVPAEYMSGETEMPGIPNPYSHSLQWSRRFIGLKVFMTLAVAGWSGYEELIKKQIRLGDELRRQLNLSGWKIINKTILPIVCFTDNLTVNGNSANHLQLEKTAKKINESGKAWISTTRLSSDLSVLRACITNYKTDDNDVKFLVKTLDETRKTICSKKKFNSKSSAIRY